jgi:hypothetical protein
MAVPASLASTSLQTTNKEVSTLQMAAPMATPQPVQLPIPGNFSSLERSLVEKTELALVEGLQLERWTRDPNRKIDLHPLNLNRQYRLPNKAYGYFANVLISDRTLSALGARQEVEFGKITGQNPEQRLKDYVLRLFLNASQWVYPDGDPGGFTFKQMLYCTADGKYGRYSDDQLTSLPDWNLIGPKYRWSLFTGYLHDFVIILGPLRKVLKEAVAVVQHPDFIHIVENPKPGYKLEVAIGYPFIDYAPIPNFFGFGPGKFDWAVKTYSFLLRDNNDVRCEMDFVAGARPRRVFDFGEFIPDPLYGTAGALQFLTLGIFNAQRVHDFMDLQMAKLHSQVHQALMEGSAKVFASWIEDNAL